MHQHEQGEGSRNFMPTERGCLGRWGSPSETTGIPLVQIPPDPLSLNPSIP